MINKTYKNLIVSFAVFGLLTAVSLGNVYATCEDVYGGGEKCIINKSFRIEKEVRIKGDSTWKEKVTLEDLDDVVEFKITVRNTGELEVDNVKMEDILPDELIRVGGSGLTEYFDNFKPGESEKFVIEAELTNDAKDENKADCFVNRAKVIYNDHVEGEDVATVCIETGDITELPKTGFDALTVLTALGLGSIALGTVIRKSAK